MRKDWRCVALYSVKYSAKRAATSPKGSNSLIASCMRHVQNFNICLPSHGHSEGPSSFCTVIARSARMGIFYWVLLFFSYLSSRRRMQVKTPLVKFRAKGGYCENREQTTGWCVPAMLYGLQRVNPVSAQFKTLKKKSKGEREGGRERIPEVFSALFLSFQAIKLEANYHCIARLSPLVFSISSQFPAAECS